MSELYSSIEAHTKDLMVETFTVAFQMDPMLAHLRPEFDVRQVAETMAYQFRAMLRVPGETIQDREVARWPDGWWQAVKWAARGWWPGKLRVRLRYVTLKEMLLYPDIPVPPYSKCVRVYWMTAAGSCLTPE